MQGCSDSPAEGMGTYRNTEYFTLTASPQQTAFSVYDVVNAVYNCYP